MDLATTAANMSPLVDPSVVGVKFLGTDDGAGVTTGSVKRPKVDESSVYRNLQRSLKKINKSY